MKKSEMIQILYEAINGHMDVVHDSHVSTAAIKHGLASMEEAGMLPPDYMSPTGCPCNLPNCTAKGIVNEWEDDEEE